MKSLLIAICAAIGAMVLADMALGLLPSGFILSIIYAWIAYGTAAATFFYTYSHVKD